MAAYFSQNAPLGTQYQSLTTEPPSDNGPTNIQAVSPNEGASSVIDNPPATELELPRRCSVRGCVSIIPADSTNKMCEACRGRHRIYAMTKRAKRKMEKEALTQQSVALLSTEQPPGTVWLPETPECDDEQQEPINVSISGVARETSQLPTEPLSQASDSTPIPYGVPQPAPWDHSVLDPRLVSSQSSELAGALTLPIQPVVIADATRSKSPEISSMTVQNASASSSSQGLEDGMDSHDVDAPYIAPAGAQTSSKSPSRFCSVKGCKAMIPADYFFKMCEPCRDRYRGYGITKRAKWRAERVAANAELEALRVEEDKRRADEGLPPLAESPEDWIAWQNDLVEGPLLIHTEDKHGPFPARMCTVSHCHAILPEQYKYRRCEQHRLQNRHHSKLKRIREKEVKAQAAALVTKDSNDEFRIWAPRGESSKKKDEEVGPLFTNVPMALDRSARSESGDLSEAGDETAGTLSAAGGSRRTNHVCSIKGCHNLLAPQIPWKMCDICREHDRENRKNKKLRDLGQLPPVRFHSNIGTLKKGGKLKNISSQEVIGSPAQSTLPEDSAAASSSTVASSSNDANEVFADILYPDGVTFNTPSSGMNGDTSNFQQNEVSAPVTTIVDDTGGVDTISSNTAETAAPTGPESSENTQPRKRRGKNKAKEPSTTTGGKGKDDTAATTPPTQALASNQVPVPFPYGLPYGAPIHSTYQVPYYMPPPHYTIPAPPPPSTSASASASTSTSTPASTSQTTALQQPPPAQPMYQYPPQTYAPYPPYGPNPYAPQQPYAQYPYPYLAPQYNASQPHLQPYGSVYPGQLPYTYGPPKSAAPQKPRTIKPVQRRKRRRDDQELPGPNGSTSYTSVFSARDTSPTPAPDPKPASNIETSLPPENTSGHDVPMAEPQQHDTTISSRKCTNQSCRRDLPAATNGTFCERCRERMKKRLVKAKHRFKLEPRKPIARSDTVGKEGDAAVDDSSGKEVEA